MGIYTCSLSLWRRANEPVGGAPAVSVPVEVSRNQGPKAVLIHQSIQSL